MLCVHKSSSPALLCIPSKLLFDKYSSNQCFYSDFICQLDSLLPLPIYLIEELNYRAHTAWTRHKNRFLYYILVTLRSCLRC